MRLMNYNYCTQDATVITASSEDSNFLASNLKHPFRSKRWRSTSVTSENVVFDLVTTEAIDSVVLLWPREDGIKLSNTATITIQANATNVWTSPAVSQTLTINNDYELASHYFSTDQNYRYWRVVIADSGNPYGYIELGVVWLGKSLNIENAQNGFKYSLVDRSKLTTTDFGHVYVDQYPTLATLTFNYQLMDYSAIQTLENSFRVNGYSLPVFIVLDETDSVFSKDHFAIYGKFASPFASTQINYKLFNTDSIQVNELA